MMTPTLDISPTASVSGAFQQGSGESPSLMGRSQANGLQPGALRPGYLQPGELQPGPSQRPPVSLQANEGNSAQYRLRHFNQQVNTIAKSLRSDDQALEKIQTLLNKAERPLTDIKKSFPPYPVGSEERVKLLKSFSSYRKMIDKLSIPAVKDQTVEIEIIQPSSPEGQIPIAGADPADHQAGHPGEKKTLLKEIAIPGLKIDANDKEIAAALEKINDAKTSVMEKRSKIFNKAAEIKEMLHQGHPYGESIGQPLGPSEEKRGLNVDPEGLSRHIKEGLLSVPAGYMHANRSLMIDLL